MSLQPGVYQTNERYSALVFSVKEDGVYYVANVDGKLFDVHGMDPTDFLKQYPIWLPAYPLRRCARVYAASLFPKSEQAQRVLRHLLAT